jgi:hypothetical protein
MSILEGRVRKGDAKEELFNVIIDGPIFFSFLGELKEDS